MIFVDGLNTRFHTFFVAVIAFAAQCSAISARAREINRAKGFRFYCWFAFIANNILIF